MTKIPKNTNYYQIPGGFTLIPDKVAIDPNLTITEKRVFCHILRRSQEYTYCFERNQIMAEFLGISKDRLIRNIASLKKKKYIRAEGRGSTRKLFPVQLYGGTAGENRVEEPAPMYLRKAN